MNTTTKRSLHLTLAASFRVVMLASVGITAAACGMPEDGTLDDITTKTDELTTGGGVIYDNINFNGTREIYQGVSIHVCPTGFAMQGAYGDQWFKCRPFTPAKDALGVPKPRVLNLLTQGTYTPPAGSSGSGSSYTRMHSCDAGQVMVGLNIGKNWLICQDFQGRAAPYQVGFYRDDRSQDTEGKNIVINKPPVMHDCGYSMTDDLMSGIQNSANQLGCLNESIFPTLPPAH